VTDRSHVRLVLGDDEDQALDALSRLSADGGLLLGSMPPWWLHSFGAALLLSLTSDSALVKVSPPRC
jgi:hypothetical protein